MSVSQHTHMADLRAAVVQGRDGMGENDDGTMVAKEKAPPPAMAHHVASFYPKSQQAHNLLDAMHKALEQEKGRSLDERENAALQRTIAGGMFLPPNGVKQDEMGQWCWISESPVWEQRHIVVWITSAPDRGIHHLILYNVLALLNEEDMNQAFPTDEIDGEPSIMKGLPLGTRAPSKMPFAFLGGWAQVPVSSIAQSAPSTQWAGGGEGGSGKRA